MDLTYSAQSNYVENLNMPTKLIWGQHLAADDPNHGIERGKQERTLWG